MGSDVNNSNKFFKEIIKFFSNNLWSSVIVKTLNMKLNINLKDVNVIPNGVDFNKFSEIDKLKAQNKLNWKSKYKNILFASDPLRKEKNYKLAKESIDLLKENIKINYLKNIRREDVYLHYNAADVLLLTSIHEGSPNAIKEAMACGCSIVSTDVGDVKEIIKNTKGCFIADFNKFDIADKISKALKFNKKTNGRKNVSYLKSEIIAKKIKNLHMEVI